MKSYVFLPIIAGLSIVVQNGLSSLALRQFRLGSVVFVNGAVCTLCAVIAAIVSQGRLEIRWQEIRSPTLPIVISGLCGFLILWLAPLSFKNIGAKKTLSILIAVQLVGATLWDFGIKKEALSLRQLVGVGVTLLGAFIVVTGGSK